MILPRHRRRCSALITSSTVLATAMGAGGASATNVDAITVPSSAAPRMWRERGFMVQQKQSLSHACSCAGAPKHHCLHPAQRGHPGINISQIAKQNTAAHTRTHTVTHTPHTLLFLFFSGHPSIRLRDSCCRIECTVIFTRRMADSSSKRLAYDRVYCTLWYGMTVQDKERDMETREK